MSPKEIVAHATDRLFNLKDLSAVDELFGPVYIQHSALAPDGTQGLRGLVSGLSADSRYDLVRILSDGDLVVAQGVFHGFAPVPLLGFDVWRVEGDRVVEHWDALGPLAGVAPNGHTPLDGPREPSSRDDTDQSRSIVESVAGGVLLGVSDGSAPLPVASDYVDHDPHGLDGRAEFERRVSNGELRRRVLHQVIAEGDLVYTRSEGGSEEAPVIANDLWRVANGAIAEHWALVVPVPPRLPHGNGAF
ncbi:nuclear transport factor 2 family protein [Cnuibacter sp. UC19_7]|uniref:nuclear transport factor 2 family protein n=1 Tax=Cnuibacter sp. UC19_7 TaxID=3350166 RepID=UPI00366E191E